MTGSGATGTRWWALPVVVVGVGLGSLGLSGCASCSGRSEPAPESVEADAEPEVTKRKKVDSIGEMLRLGYRTNHPMSMEGVAEPERVLSEPVRAARELVEAGGPGNAADARARLDEVVAGTGEGLELPDKADALYWRARSWHVEDILEQAIPDYEAAIAADPDFASPRRWLAYSLYQQNSCEEALSHLEKVVELLPEDGTAHHHLALCLLDQMKAREGRQAAAKACELGHAAGCALSETLTNRGGGPRLGSKARGKGGKLGSKAKGKGKRLRARFGKGKGKGKRGMKAKWGAGGGAQEDAGE